MDLRQRPESARGEGERIEIDEASRRPRVFEAGILAGATLEERRTAFRSTSNLELVRIR